jgi:hypothetical protein
VRRAVGVETVGGAEKMTLSKYWTAKSPPSRMRSQSRVLVYFGVARILIRPAYCPSTLASCSVRMLSHSSSNMYIHSCCARRYVANTSYCPCYCRTKTVELYLSSVPRLPHSTKLLGLRTCTPSLGPWIWWSQRLPASRGNVSWRAFLLGRRSSQKLFIDNRLGWSHHWHPYTTIFVSIGTGC